jgi:hypothetical protein
MPRDSFFLRSYRGLPLAKATLSGRDVTDVIKVRYTDAFNWQGKLWSLEDCFGEDCYLQCMGRELYVEFIFGSWYKIQIENLDTLVNPIPLLPFNQIHL